MTGGAAGCFAEFAQRLGEQVGKHVAVRAGPFVHRKADVQQLIVGEERAGEALAEADRPGRGVADDRSAGQELGNLWTGCVRHSEVEGGSDGSSDRRGCRGQRPRRPLYSGETGQGVGDMSRAQQTGELQNGTQSMGSTYGQRNFDRQQAPPVAASVGDVGREGDLQTASGGRYAAPRQIPLEAAGDRGQDHVGQGSSEAGSDPANVGVGELASNQAPAPSHRTVEGQGQRRQRGVRHHLVQSQEGGAYLFARELHRSVKQILSGQRPVLDPLGHSLAGAETGREHVAVAVAVAVALAVDGRPLRRNICDLRAAVEQDLEEIAGAQSVRRGEVRLDEQGVSVGVEAGQEVNFPERSPGIERLAESGVEC